jgi:hypothetical protein
LRKKNIFKAKKRMAVVDQPPKDRNGDGKDKSAGASGADVGAIRPPLPLFYRYPQPLHNVRHAGKGLRKSSSFGFARTAHAVVLHTQEFRLAAANYPIVFAGDDTAMPLAILGIRDGENLFVDEDGQWPDAYVPAYVRRYPFATGQGAEADEQILYLDEDSDRIVDCAADPAAEPLFVDGEPSERTTEIREFCAAFQQQIPITQAFIEEVKQRDLLVSKDIRLDLPAGASQQVTGLRIIEEEKFDALPDEAILEWRQRGWLPLVYWHWLSIDNFLRLLKRSIA